MRSVVAQRSAAQRCRMPMRRDTAPHVWRLRHEPRPPYRSSPFRPPPSPTPPPVSLAPVSPPAAPFRPISWPRYMLPFFAEMKKQVQIERLIRRELRQMRQRASGKLLERMFTGNVPQSSIRTANATIGTRPRCPGGCWVEGPVMVVMRSAAAAEWGSVTHNNDNHHRLQQPATTKAVWASSPNVAGAIQPAPPQRVSAAAH